MAGTAVTSALIAEAVSAPTRAAIGWGTDRTAHPHESGKRPLRLTRRGRIVRMVVLIVLAWLAVGLFAATASHADGETGPLPTAVVQKNDTLWDIAARYRPSRDPFAMVEEIRELNGLSGYTIQPGQELRLPRGR
ncbi:LysM peptidoglycan-binding domain-containing protein [Catenuloplanes sp. NPDC051500]|uniref:LysM peptidoglycan-binding domain-containing protein n=1 Tax=Catenuloplanes sp. NPDC051500 TaxID=3363959 RepID=UPI003797E335